METIRSTYAYRPANPEKHDLIVPTTVVARYAFSNQAMADARKRHADPQLEFDIQTNGIKSPLIIFTNGTSGLLGDGYQRLGIAQKLGIKKLPIQIHPNNFRRLRTENGFPNLEPKLKGWVEKNLLVHADHSIIRHVVGGIGSAGIPATRWMKCKCSCGASWKEEA